MIDEQSRHGWRCYVECDFPLDVVVIDFETYFDDEYRWPVVPATVSRPSST
jgi:hypothetical protein